MKKIISVILALSMLLSMSAAMADGLTAGTYSATVDGRNGPLTLSVTVDEAAITGVEIGEHQETPGVADPAFTILVDDVIKYQSVGVDTITGATVTSEAVLLGISECLKQAGANLDDWNKEVTKVAGEDIELTADVIVIGGGGAGLAAAATAGENGASVILIEKAAALGGNTILAGGAYNTSDVEVQKKDQMADATRKELESYLNYKEEDFGAFAGTLTTLKQQITDYLASGETYLFDSVELHMIHSYTGSKREALDGTVIEPNFDLISTLCNNTLDGWHWLQEIGTPTNEALSTAVGALWKRTHGITVPDNGSKPLIDALEAHARKQNVEIIMNTEATDFITENGKVVGVNAVKNDGTKVILRANKGVVLASGGFAGNIDMVLEYNNYWPDMNASVKTDNTATAKGDGIRMAQAVGANTVGMGFIQMLPTCTALDGLAGKGVGSRMYVNAEGLRYVNESSERDVLCKAALAQTNSMFFGVGDANMIKTQGEAKINDSVKKGYVFVADTLEEVAKLAGVNPENLVATVEKFNTYVDAQNDPEFGRYNFAGKVEEAPFVLAAMAPALHHTMGGVEINTDAQVINASGEIIPGLYAAGEVCGGIHAGNRLGGNAIADIIVFGRIAGANAAMAK